VTPLDVTLKWIETRSFENLCSFYEAELRVIHRTGRIPEGFDTAHSGATRIQLQRSGLVTKYRTRIKGIKGMRVFYRLTPKACALLKLKPRDTMVPESARATVPIPTVDASAGETKDPGPDGVDADPSR
jgi:hypothetical protein